MKNILLAGLLLLTSFPAFASEVAGLSFVGAISEENHVGVPFTSQPILALTDEKGEVISTDNTSVVEIFMIGDDGTNKLSGTTMQTAVNGVVSFSNLAPTAAGEGFHFTAEVLGTDGKTSAHSEMFDVQE